jgi:uncharacterized protein DUF1254
VLGLNSSLEVTTFHDNNRSSDYFGVRRTIELPANARTRHTGCNLGHARSGHTGIRNGAQRDLGAAYNDIIYMSKPPAPQQVLLTPTNQTPYVIVMMDTSDGPVILDVPPVSKTTVFFGTVIDAWQLPLVDVGPAGEDAGKGGKYLFLPPGYDKPAPTGYLVYQPKTFHLYVALRPISVNGVAFRRRSDTRSS